MIHFILILCKFAESFMAEYKHEIFRSGWIIRNERNIQWNLSCEATSFSPEKWPFKRDDPSSVEIDTIMFIFT